MNLLLDTHVILWWLEDSKSLTERARKLITAEANTLFVSAVSLWELRIKQQIGKVRLPRNFSAVLKEEAFEELALTISHTDALVGLPEFHKDPFDRMLIAQAQVEELMFVSHDKIVAKYPVDHFIV